MCGLEAMIAPFRPDIDPLWSDAGLAFRGGGMPDRHEKSGVRRVCIGSATTDV